MARRTAAGSASRENARNISIATGRHRCSVTFISLLRSEPRVPPQGSAGTRARRDQHSLDAAPLVSARRSLPQRARSRWGTVNPSPVPCSHPGRRLSRGKRSPQRTPVTFRSDRWASCRTRPIRRSPPRHSRKCRRWIPLRNRRELRLPATRALRAARDQDAAVPCTPRLFIVAHDTQRQHGIGGSRFETSSKHSPQVEFSSRGAACQRL